MSSNPTPAPPASAGPQKTRLSALQIILIIAVIVGGLVILSVARSSSEDAGRTACPSSLTQNDGGLEGVTDAFQRGLNNCE